MNTHESESKPKVSDTLMSFAAPLLEGLAEEGKGVDEFRTGLMVAVTVWNSSVMAIAGNPSYLDQARTLLSQNDASALPLFDLLLERKEKEFSKEQWLIGQWDIHESPAGLRLKATAHKPPNLH